MKSKTKGRNTLNIAFLVQSVGFLLEIHINLFTELIQMKLATKHKMEQID
jgi:hypothetical protein